MSVRTQPGSTLLTKHAAALQRSGNETGERVQRSLGQGIGGCIGGHPGKLARTRGHVDDAAESALGHCWCERAGHLESAEDIRLQHLAKRLEIDVEHALAVTSEDGGIVDQNIHPPRDARDVGARATDALAAGHIERLREHVQAFGLQGCSRALCGFTRSARQDHAVALTSQLPAGFQPESAVPTSDERNGRGNSHADRSCYGTMRTTSPVAADELRFDT